MANDQEFEYLIRSLIRRRTIAISPRKKASSPQYRLDGFDTKTGIAMVRMLVVLFRITLCSRVCTRAAHDTRRNTGETGRYGIRRESKADYAGTWRKANGILRTKVHAIRASFIQRFSNPRLIRTLGYRRPHPNVRVKDLGAGPKDQNMETYSFSSYKTAEMLMLVATDAGMPEALREDFASAIEAKIAREIPTWGTARIGAGGKIGKALKQPTATQKVAEAGTITLTPGGIRRYIPSSWTGQIVSVDAAMAALGKRGVNLATPMPEAESALLAGIEGFAKEFIERNKPAENAPAPAPTNG